MAVSLILGGVSFHDFELPEQIHAGGQHAGTLHKLPGGERLFQAAGPDDHPIRWSGRFQGGDAVGRAEQVDSMRIAGGLVSLFAVGMFRLVVVHDFKFTVEKSYQVLYEVECMVIENPGSMGIGGLLTDLASVLSGDLSYIAASTVADVSGFVSSFSGVAFNTIAPNVAQSLYSTASAFAGTLGASIASNELTLGLSDFATMDPADAVNTLATQTATAVAQDGLNSLQGHVQRVAINLTSRVQ